MKKDERSRLLQRFLSGRQEGKDAYFDASEIDDLLESFEETDDYTHYDEVLALGLRLHPGNTDLLIRQCKLFAHDEEFDEAISLIETLGEVDNPELDTVRLECYCMLDEYSKIIEYIETLIAGDCDYLEILFENIAPILSDSEMYTEARDFIDRGLLLFPDNLVLKDELCYLYEALGDIDKAIEVCNELIDKNPYSYDYWFTIGRLHSMKSDFEKAIESFDFALTCDDSDEELKILKAYCLYMNENYERAIEEYNEVEINSDTRKRIIPLLAECYVKMEKYEDAYNLLKGYILKKGSEEDVSAYINFIRCCAETERHEEASKALFEAGQMFPNNVRVLSLLALTHLENGNDKQAMEMTDRLFDVLDSSEEKDPEDYESLYHAGKLLYMKGEFDKALKFYHKVLEMNPQMPFIHLQMAMVYLAKRDVTNFNEQFNMTTTDEIAHFLESEGWDMNRIMKIFDNENDPLSPKFKQIPPEDLVKEYLKNKDNKN